jgi:Rrf2 family protein
MLRLSKKADYGLIAMKHLALLPESGSLSAREIAERYDIPVEVLAKVLQRLARQGLLASHQGTRGGYHLARPATAISVADVIQAIDGPISVTACFDDVVNCDQYSKCTVRDPLWRIKDRIVSALSACTVFEMATDTMSDTVFPLAGSTRPDAAASLVVPTVSR